MVALFLGISLLPKASPRYTYPLLIVPCLLLGYVLTQYRREKENPSEKPMDGSKSRIEAIWRGINVLVLTSAAFGVFVVPWLWWDRSMRGYTAADVINIAVVLFVVAFLRGRAWQTKKWEKMSGEDSTLRSADVFVRLALVSAIGMILLVSLYAFEIVPRLDQHKLDHPREIAMHVREKLPNDAVVWVLDSEYRPFWFYLEPQIEYFRLGDGIPKHARFVLLPTSHEIKRGEDRKEWEAIDKSVADHTRVNEVFDLKRHGFVVIDLQSP
jgi:hypothetical protein